MLAMRGKSTKQRAILLLFWPDPDHLRIEQGTAGVQVRFPVNARTILAGSAPIALVIRQKFDDVDAALAALVLGDERLRLLQAPSNLMLGKARLLARLGHQIAKATFSKR